MMAATIRMASMPQRMARMASFSDRVMLRIWLEVAASAEEEDGLGVVSLTGLTGLMVLDVSSETVKLDNN
jgi:hypothetical protein